MLLIMLFLLRLVRVGLFGLLALLWVYYGWALYDKLAYPEFQNPEGQGFFLAGLPLALFTAAVVRILRK